jgi:hypothetical protein
VEKQEIPKPIWPLVLATIIWSLIVVFMGLPLTGGGHGPLTAIVVVTLAPVVFPLGLLFLSTSIINVARVGFFSFLALYAAAANLVILVAIVSNFQEIVDLDSFMLWYLAVWLVLWFGGQLALVLFVVGRWKALSRGKNA